MFFDAGSHVFVCSSCINFAFYFLFMDPFGNKHFQSLKKGYPFAYHSAGLMGIFFEIYLYLNPCSPEGFSQTYFPNGGLLQPPLWIINTEGHITLNLLPVYRYGHSLSIDTKISTNH